jgi:peroxiredoxin
MPSFTGTLRAGRCLTVHCSLLRKDGGMMRMHTIRYGVLGLIVLSILLRASALSAAEQKAPDFTLKDLDGANVSLGDLKGKVAGLYFWATYCPTCEASFPIIQRLSETYARKGAVILGVNPQFSELAARFLKQKGYRLRTLHDSYGKVSTSYGIYGIPVTILIDRNGMIARRYIGEVPEKEISDTIDKLLRDSSVASSAVKPKSSPAVCEPIALDSPPTWSSGRILVPMRGILEWLGASVTWNEKARTVTAKKGSKSIEIAVGSRKARVGGKDASLDAPAQMVNGRVYVPLRFVGEALGVKVEYRPQDGGILLESGAKCGFVAL